MAMLFSQPVCAQGEMAHPVVPLAMQGLSEGEPPRHGHSVVTESLMLSVIIVHLLTLALSLSISYCNYHPAGRSPALSHGYKPCNSPHDLCALYKPCITYSVSIKISAGHFN